MLFQRENLARCSNPGGQLHALTRMEKQSKSPPDLNADNPVCGLVNNDDQDLFQLLVQRYKDQVYRLVASVLGPDNAAEFDDVVQEVFILILRKIRSFRNECPLSGWILVIARNRAIDHLRKVHRDLIYVENVELCNLLAKSPVPDAETVASAREQLNMVLQYVQQLPIRRRAAVYLYYWFGFSQSEIAERLDVNVPVVKSLLFRARRQLGKNLEADGWSYT